MAKPTNYQIFQFARNTKGLNTRDTLAGMSPQSSSGLLNVNFNNTGGVEKRSGYTKINNNALPESNCVGLINFKLGDGSLDAVGVFDDKIRKMDSYDGTWDDITGSVSLTSSPTNYASFTIGQDTLIVTNDSDVPWKYTQTGTAANLSISQFTKAKLVAYFKNRPVFMGTTEGGSYKPNRIRWANKDTLETYSTADFTDEAETADGSKIIGYGFLFDDLYIFKDSFSNGIKKMYYTGNSIAPFGLTNIGEIGAISGRSIVYVDIQGVASGLMYWGVDNKIRIFDGNRSVSLSDHIQPTLDSLSKGRLKHIKAVNYPLLNQVWFSVSSGPSSTHDTIVIYDYLNNAFLIHDNIRANEMAILNNTDGKQFLVTGNYGGLTYQQNTGKHDDNEDFNSYYKTAWLDMGQPHLAKKWRWLDSYAADLGNYNLNVSWAYDFSSSKFSSDTLDLGSDAETFPLTFPITLGGVSVKVFRTEMKGIGHERYIQITYENNNQNEPWILYRFDMLVQMMGLKDIV